MLNVSNVQHFSVGDGDGIRTTVFFKGCNLCCPWCHNPENLSFSPVELHYKDRQVTEIMGKSLSVEDLLPELLEDRAFYQQSGGGVTLSGGEAMLQAKQILPLLKALKEKEIPVLIDTAGCVPYESFALLNPYVDGYLFDFKTADPEQYRQIGGDLNTVTQNISRLMQDNATLYIRIPLIPGFNTQPESIDAICRQLTALGVTKVDLLPFHRLGSGKYEAMGLEYAYRDITPMTKEALTQIRAQYQQYFETKLER